MMTTSFVCCPVAESELVDEVSQGFWIRLVNNCRVPVVVAMFNPGTDDPGSGIYLSFPRVHD